MSHVFSLNVPLQSIFCSNESSFIKNLFFALIGVCILAIASQISIPLTPVPFTLQSITVVFIGMTYGARYGSSIVALYLIAGVCGLPVFAGAPYGVARFFGPTGGYLIGFLPASILSGYLAENGWGKNIISSFCASFLGVSIIFLFGVTGLAQFIGWHQAIISGALPFIISEPIKLAMISFLIPNFWKKA